MKRTYVIQVVFATKATILDVYLEELLADIRNLYLSHASAFYCDLIVKRKFYVILTFVSASA